MLKSLMCGFACWFLTYIFPDRAVRGVRDLPGVLEQARKLASLFQDNIGNFDVSEDIVAAGPKA